MINAKSNLFPKIYFRSEFGEQTSRSLIIMKWHENERMASITAIKLIQIY